MKWFLELSAVLALAVLLDKALPAQTPPPQVWFTAKNAATVCTVTQVFQTPIKLTWVCTNGYGSNAGSYTAGITGGVNGTNYFNIGLNSISANFAVQSDTNLSCLIQVNSTPNPQAMLNGLVIDPNSASYSCTGFSTLGNGSVSWPAIP